jgi:hypothetical protein
MILLSQIKNKHNQCTPVIADGGLKEGANISDIVATCTGE